MATETGDCVDGLLVCGVRTLMQMARCQICLDIMSSPKALQCIHTFCETCIQSVINANSLDTIKCPVCRQPTTPPKGTARGDWASRLPRNFALEPLLEHISYERDYGRADDTRTTSGHREEIQTIEFCRIHRNKRMKDYCIDHAAMLCLTCEQFHGSCRIAKISDIANYSNNSKRSQILQGELQKIRMELAKVMSVLETNVEDIKKTIDDFPNRIDKLQKRLNRMFKQIRAKLTHDSDKNKEKLSKIQREQISHCKFLDVGLSQIDNDLKHVSSCRTPAQHFIANERLQVQLSLYKINVKDATNAVHCTEVRQEAIAVMESVLNMAHDLTNIEQRRVSPDIKVASKGM